MKLNVKGWKKEEQTVTIKDRTHRNYQPHWSACPYF